MRSPRFTAQIPAANSSKLTEMLCTEYPRQKRIALLHQDQSIPEASLAIQHERKVIYASQRVGMLVPSRHYHLRVSGCSSPGTLEYVSSSCTCSLSASFSQPCSVYVNARLALLASVKPIKYSRSRLIFRSRTGGMGTLPAVP